MNETLLQKKGGVHFEKRFFSKIFTDLNALEFISKYPCRNFCINYQFGYLDFFFLKQSRFCSPR